jgi:iron complex transport system permease protein
LTWLSGTLAGRDWSDIKFTWFPILLITLLSFTLAKSLNLALLDNDTSQSLGLSLNQLRFLVGILTTLLTACAVCISGLVGFVGLVIPHLVRLLCGSDFIYILPMSALLGSTVVLGADIVARCFLGELPVGLVTSLIGSPFFVYILHKSRTKKLS